jgi:hypothetical protein
MLPIADPVVSWPAAFRPHANVRIRHRGIVASGAMLVTLAAYLDAGQNGAAAAVRR